MRDADLKRFEAKLGRFASGHWLWLGSRLRNGYGSCCINGRTEFAHRAAYEHWKGPIPTEREKQKNATI